MKTLKPVYMPIQPIAVLDWAMYCTHSTICIQIYIVDLHDTHACCLTGEPANESHYCLTLFQKLCYLPFV
jgi:hypothetical protein